MKWLFLLLILISGSTYAQCKTFKLGAKGDTLNCTDVNGMKQGKWVIKVAPLRGEPGYDEEGVFRNNLKEGVWRQYTAMGDLKSIETYRWGYKDGVSQYYSVNAGLVRQESWKAVNPEDPWDTVEVPDPIDDGKVQMVRIKLEGYSLKHGTWKFYDPYTGALTKTERWILDKLEDPNAPKKTLAVNGNEDSDTTKKAPVKVKPKEILEYEKKNSGKKKIKVRDGRTGG